jgi:hypothetical protein
MKKKLLLVGLSLSFLICGKAQHYDYPSPVTVSLGLSGASDTTVWSLFANPSGISSIKSVVVGGGCHSSFFTESLGAQSAFVLVPATYINTGVAYMRFGNDLFNIQNLSVTVARPLSPKLYMGCRFEYLHRYVQGTNRQATFLVDAGFHFQASDKIMLAVLSENLGKQVLADEYNEQPLPSSLAVACRVKLSPVFEFTTDLVHRSDLSKQIYAFGISSKIHEKVNLRGAISAKPVRLSMGATLRWHALELNIASNHHDQLGVSSTVGIAYLFGARRGGGL